MMRAKSRRAVAGAVVGDDALEVVDAVGGEPDLRPGQKSGCRGALLVSERLGVGEPGEAVDRGVEVYVATLRAR